MYLKTFFNLIEAKKQTIVYRCKAAFGLFSRFN